MPAARGSFARGSGAPMSACAKKPNREPLSSTFELQKERLREEATRWIGRSDERLREEATRWIGHSDERLREEATAPTMVLHVQPSDG